MQPVLFMHCITAPNLSSKGLTHATTHSEKPTYTPTYHQHRRGFKASRSERSMSHVPHSCRFSPSLNSTPCGLSIEDAYSLHTLTHLQLLFFVSLSGSSKLLKLGLLDQELEELSPPKWTDQRQFQQNAGILEERTELLRQLSHAVLKRSACWKSWSLSKHDSTKLETLTALGEK